MNPEALRVLVLAHLAATLLMTGLIWFVQIVHYPLFSFVGAEEFRQYEGRNKHLTRFVVAPPMLVEGATAVLLCLFPPERVSRELLWLGLSLVLVNAISTFFIQVPCHERLSRGFDAVVHRRLVGTNWLRTAAWSVRATLASWIAFMQ